MTLPTSFCCTFFAVLLAAWGMFPLAWAYGDHTPALSWTDSWNGPTNHQDKAEAVCILADGSIVVAATTYDTTLVFERLSLISYDQQGNILWSTVDPTRTRVNNMILSATGDLLISGYSREGNELVMFVRRVNAANGSVIWHKIHATDSGSQDFGPAVAEDAVSGEVLIAGTLNDDFLVVRYALADGALIDTHTFDGPQ